MGAATLEPVSSETHTPMSQPLGIDDFFALEAGEYLDRLASLAATPTAPNADELVRFTRALRGSALMANQQAIARAANGFEHLVRGYRDGRRPWDANLAALSREAVDVLRTLVERVRGWTPDDSARAERLAQQLELAAGNPPVPATAPTPAATETGVRVFLARESAALGSVLDQAGRTLGSGTPSPDALLAILRRMQPLRGLAALADFPPLPDLLDGIDRTITSLTRLELPAHEGGARLDAAAAALARSARDIAEHGRPDPEAAEFRSFAERLLTPEAQEPAIVPIESLYYAGQDGIVHRGTPPRGNAATAMSAAAVVSRGEHLCHAADEITESRASAQRNLRLHLLLADLRTLSAGLPAGLEASVEAFSVAARSAVARGAAAGEPVRFAALIREAGSRLRNYTEVTQPASLTSTFAALVGGLNLLGVALSDESDVVPIESLAPDAPELDAPVHASPPPITAEPVMAPNRASASVAFARAVSASPPPKPGRETWDLAASFSLYEELTAFAPDRAREAVAAPVAATPRQTLEPALVDIGELLYRGRAALERADLIRLEIRAAWSTPESTGAIQPLVEELLDLVELAIAD